MSRFLRWFLCDGLGWHSIITVFVNKEGGGVVMVGACKRCGCSIKDLWHIQV